MKTRIKFFVSLCLCGAVAGAQNIPNPVLPGVADAGVMKFNGKYYIGGVNTYGDFYVSPDLVNWGKPIHAVTMDNEWTKGSGAGNNQIHSNTMLYLNGQFNLYWSVNYWGRDKHAVHIVHATADNALGPYTEPVRNTWMDNRIDPHVFKDDNGDLYMYMVRFTDGNTIWGRKMKTPGNFDGDPVCHFSSLPDTWETMDNRVEEGPWVIKYRNRYYMMYNSNHTSTEWGNYQLGVAEADAPLAFQHGGKYSYPVVKSSRFDLEDDYCDVLRYGRGYAPHFGYTETQPERGWTKSDFDDSRWKKGETGFASRRIEGSTVRHQGTEWTSGNLYLRKHFEVTDTERNYALLINHDGDTKVWLNGKPLYEKAGADYCVVNLSREQLRALKRGDNLIAVETRKGKRGNFFDIALFDMRADKAGNLLFTPGQPNIVRGPNGFEWWLVYMANKNNERRGQYIDRIHFFDKTLYVDGITDRDTPGRHPLPAKPTWGSTFDEASVPADDWTGGKAQWTVKGGEWITASSPSYNVLNPRYAASAYLFETGIKPRGNAGVIAFRTDEDNYIRVGLNEERNTWYLLTRLGGTEQAMNFALPDDFKWGVYHNIRLERNADRLRVWIDDIPAPGKSLFTGLPADKAVPGLFAGGETSAFDGVAYTIGFDEYDAQTAAWNTVEGGFVKTDKGLRTETGRNVAWKGEALDSYEFTAQITNASNQGAAGIYPVYIDADNYVEAIISADSKKLEVTRVENGRTLSETAIPLEHLQTLYTDVKYTDFVDKGYRTQSPVWLDKIRVSRHDVGDKNKFADDMFALFNIEYLSGGAWKPLPEGKTGVADHPMYNELSFAPVKAEGFRFINKNPQDLNRHIYKIRINELLKDSYNLRAVREADRLCLFVDGRQVAELAVTPEKSRVGLCSDGCEATFNGILYYHINR